MPQTDYPTLIYLIAVGGVLIGWSIYICREFSLIEERNNKNKISRLEKELEKEK